VTVYEGEGRGGSRRVRIDIHLNFIGRFEVPAEIVTPMELEEQRRIQEEQAAKAKYAQEREQERNEKRKAASREFTERKNAGLLTPEELEEYNRKREHSRAWQKEWRDKRKASEPPKPPKPLSRNEIVKRHYAGLPLTDEEYAIYRAWQNKKTEQARERRHRIKESQPPTAKPPTIKSVLEKRSAGAEFTPEETEIYNRFRETRNDKLRDYNREYQRNYLREKRQAETEEERQARNAKRREAYNSRKAVQPMAANQ
jgi:hypothetical protein